jgi:hypothetical protein
LATALEAPDSGSPRPSFAQTAAVLGAAARRGVHHHAVVLAARFALEYPSSDEKLSLTERIVPSRSNSMTACALPMAASWPSKSALRSFCSVMSWRTSRP